MVPRRSLRALAPALAALLLITQFPAPAAADHGGRPIGSFLECNDRVPPRCTSVGNDRQHFVAFDASLTPAIAAAMRDSILIVYHPTDLSMYPRDSVTSVTDVVAYSRDYGENGAAGWVNCPESSPQGVNENGHRWCKLQELHLNYNARYAIFFGDEASLRHIACHELGHSIGLRHWGNPPQSEGPTAPTCMNANTPDGPTNLDQIDRDHIDAYY